MKFKIGQEIEHIGDYWVKYKIEGYGPGNKTYFLTSGNLNQYHETRSRLYIDMNYRLIKKYSTKLGKILYK